MNRSISASGEYIYSYDQLSRCVMEKEQLAFKCRACKQVAEKNELDSRGFDIVAYEDMMDWSDFSQSVPGLDEQIWQRTITAPSKGEMKKVQVYFPFHMSVGETFWTLFRPALSSFNGWEEHPDEIGSSALVKCRFESILSKNEEKAWITLAIKEVLPLTEICDKLPEKEGAGYLDGFKMFGASYVMKYNEWILFDAGAQGDLGIWALVRQHSKKSSLVAYGEWGFHSSLVYCANKVLPESELNELLERSITYDD
ncbi:MAG: hypothetical protein E6230_26875 [Paenibacillus dendritiformis]|uniref:hypothetical protein n=2 Tax=Paenibacillus TaxID=44249 RepID=UPI0025FA236C|nr:hypothetical protein [uncultured Paenibacillus sp.]MDU5145798.1 hypothetical protein [Paenibacillus dendritiformis]